MNKDQKHKIPDFKHLEAPQPESTELSPLEKAQRHEANKLKK